MSLDRQETPTLSKVLKDAISVRLGDLHTCLPGIVDSVDHVKKIVDVRLSLKRKYRLDESPIELPKLVKVPLGFLQTKETIISVPVASGDDVWVYFSERSLDIWKSTSDQDSIENRIVNPSDPRMHHFSDAVAVPMFKPIENGLPSNDTDIMIEHKAGNRMTIAPTGEFTYVNTGGSRLNTKPSGKWFMGNNSEELISIVSEFLQLVIDAKTNTMLGPMPFINNPAFVSLKSRLDSALKQ